MSLYQPIHIYGPIYKRVERIKFLTGRCRGKSVLHIGCADFPITEQRISSGKHLHVELTREAKSCLGIDISEEGISGLKKAGFDNVKQLNAEHIDGLGDRYDVVMAGDVLEHMSNPGLFLASVQKVLNPGGELIVGVPNALSWNLLRVLLQKFEPTHHEHCFYLTPKSLTELCRRYYLTPTGLAYTVQPRDPGESRTAVLVRDLLCRIAPKLSPSFIMTFEVNPERKNATIYD
jgi:2-polyprenyl-3-methyl-5-hydroxy-6-metoxy-1,4-benzoquinol methylase